MTTKELNACKYITSMWSGGSTTQILIHPVSSSYTERNFDFRVSSATVEVDESVFSNLNGYDRHLSVLNGTLELTHDEIKWETIKCLQTYHFDGGLHTRSRGRVVDFNVMTNKKCLSEVSVIYNSSAEATAKEKYSKRLTLLYASNADASVNVFGETGFQNFTIAKGDSLIIYSNEKLLFQSVNIVVCATIWYN